MKKRKKTPKRISFTKLADPGNQGPINIYTHGGRFSGTPASMPSEVRIYGQVYRVHYHSFIYSEPRVNQRLRGVVIYGPRCIFIDPDQSLHDMRETLYHEVGHVYLKVWQTKSEPLSKITYQQTEDFCDLMGEAICDLARNNPLPN